MHLKNSTKNVINILLALKDVLQTQFWPCSTISTQFDTVNAQCYQISSKSRVFGLKSIKIPLKMHFFIKTTKIPLPV